MTASSNDAPLRPRRTAGQVIVTTCATAALLTAAAVVPAAAVTTHARNATRAELGDAIKIAAHAHVKATNGGFVHHASSDRKRWPRRHTDNTPTDPATALPTDPATALPTVTAPAPGPAPSEPSTSTPTPSVTSAAVVTPAAPSPTATSIPTAPAPQPSTASPTPAPTSSQAPAPTNPPASGGPSGLAMPTGDLAGWHQVFADDFTGSRLSSSWGAYSGQPGGNPAGWWMPSHTYAAGGAMVLDGYADGGKNASGGAAAWGASQLTYGKYEVRMRADQGNGYGYVLLLWPASGKWPVDGEIDFAEDGGADRQSTAATLHYGASNSQIAHGLNADFTKWHTIGVEWTPGKLVYTLDGAAWATVTGASVPSTPMFLAIQQAALPCSVWSTCVDSTTPAHTKILVDWVSVYSRSTSTPAGLTAAAAVPAGIVGLATRTAARRQRPSRRRRTT